MDASAFEKLSVAELSHFLTEKGIPATFCKAFEGIAKQICICTYLCCIFISRQKTLSMDEHFSGFRRSTLRRWYRRLALQRRFVHSYPW